jgi:hypothetical protein
MICERGHVGLVGRQFFLFHIDANEQFVSLTLRMVTKRGNLRTVRIWKRLELALLLSTRELPDKLALWLGRCPGKG